MTSYTPQIWFSLREVSHMMGSSKNSVLKEINGAKLKAVILPGRGGRPRAYRVHRSELTRWMVAGGVPVEHVAAMLNPGRWLLLVGCDGPLQAALGGRVRMLPSLFHLGWEIRTRPAWAAVVDLAAVGTAEACRALGGLAARPDRPRLIGLYDDSEAGVDGRAAAVFDNLFSRSAGPAALARSIHYLSPDLRALDLRDTDARRGPVPEEEAGDEHPGPAPEVRANQGAEGPEDPG